METENGELKNQVQTLEEENAKKSEAIKELETENGELKNQVQTLEEENAKLKSKEKVS